MIKYPSFQLTDIIVDKLNYVNTHHLYIQYINTYNFYKKYILLLTVYIFVCVCVFLGKDCPSAGSNVQPQFGVW